MSGVRSAQRGVKMRQNESVIMRSCFKPVVFSDLNYYHGSMLVY